MKDKRNVLWICITAGLFVLFVVFTVIVKVADVQAVGPEGTSVGLATVNGGVAKGLGFNKTMYDLTQCLGIFALFVAACFVVLALCKFIKGHSFKKVDKDLYVLLLVYALVAILYVFFEKAVVNYRPVILEYAPEASYPSTHTMLACCIFATAALQLKDRIKNKKLSLAAMIVFFLFAAVTVIGRLVSGVHWFTDIIGGIILSGALIALYITLTYWRKKEAEAADGGKAQL